MADFELNEQLLVVDDEETSQPTPQPKTLAQRAVKNPYVIGAVALCAVAAVALAIAGATGKLSSGNNEGSSAVTDEVLYNRPKFSYVPLSGDRDVHFQQTPCATGSGSCASYTSDNYSYDLEMEHDFHAPELNEDIHKIDCADDHVVVKFASNSAAKSVVFKAGTVLPLHGSWGCSSHIRQLTHDAEIFGDTLIAKTKNVTLASVVKNAHISYKGTKPSSAAASSPIPAGGNRKRRDDWISDLENFYDEAKPYINDFITGAEDLSAFINADGGYTYDGSPWSKTITLPTPDCSKIVGELQGSTSCSLTLDLTAHVDVVIADYQLKSFEATMTGELTANIQANGVGYSWSYSHNGFATLWQDKYSTFLPVAGFPIPLDFYVMVSGGYEFQASAGVHFTGSVTASGSVDLGMKYTQGETDLGYVHDYNLNPVQHSFSVTEDVSATLNLHLLPSLYLEVAYIGGPTVNPSLTSTVEATESYGEGSSCNEKVQVDVNAGFSVTIGAKIDVELGSEKFDKSWNSQSLYSKQWQLLDQCYAL